MINKLFIVGIFSLSAAFAADHSVKFSVTLKPMGSFEAKTSSVQVKGKAERTKDGFVAENIVVDAASFKTGIDLRDKHMRDKYFEVEKFPSATLVKGEASKDVFKGELQVHGVTQVVTGKYEVKGDELVITFPTKVSDFKIPPAKYMGVGVQDDIQVEVRMKIPTKPGGT